MDFELTVEQRALVDLVRTIVAGRFPLSRVRRAEEARQVVDRDDWAALGEAGVFSLCAPADAGGAGLGLGDAAVVFEELGRALVPGPLVPSQLAASLAGGGWAETGRVRVAPLCGALDGSLIVGATARRPPDGSGPLLVEHLESLDALVVAESDGSMSLVEAGAIKASPVERSLDPLTPLSTVVELPAGEPIAGGAAAGRRFVREHRVLTGAYLAGLAAGACGMAVDYAKGRRQFGRTIGSFQAIKHLCADMLVRVEIATVAVEAAAVTADQPDVGDPERAAAGAALMAAEAAIANAKTCVQVHGGMGFTWDVPVHLYVMRARVLAAGLGPLDELATTVAERW